MWLFLPWSALLHLLESLFILTSFHHIFIPPLPITRDTKVLLPQTEYCYSPLFREAIPCRVKGGRRGGTVPYDSSNFVFLLQSTGLPETLKPLISGQPIQWRCYARLVTPQHVFLTFLPSTFSGICHRPSSLAPQIHTPELPHWVTRWL